MSRPSGGLMSRSNDEKDDQTQLGRRAFLRMGGLGAAALSAGARRAEVAPETPLAGQTGPAQSPQTPPAQAPPAPAQPARPPRSSPYKRNFDPVPASEPSMNFAAF